MLNTLNIPPAQQFNKDKQFFVGYIMMCLYHSLIRISDFRIIFHSGSTCKIKYETTQSIRDLRTWKYGTVYIFAPKKSIFMTGIYMQRLNYFELLIILLYQIAQIIYIIVKYPNNFYVILFFFNGHSNFISNIVWYEFLFHVVNI